MSILIAQGVHLKAIQKLLRRSSIQLTMDTTVSLFEQVQQNTADTMDELFAQLSSKLSSNLRETKPN